MVPSFTQLEAAGLSDVVINLLTSSYRQRFLKLDTILPDLLFIRVAFVRPPTVFAFLPLKTAALAYLPLAMTLTFLTFIAFMAAFIAGFMAAFMAGFIAAFMAFPLAAFIAGAMASQHASQHERSNER